MNQHYQHTWSVSKGQAESSVGSLRDVINFIKGFAKVSFASHFSNQSTWSCGFLVGMRLCIIIEYCCGVRI